MGVKFTNNAEGTLTAGVGAGDTTNMTLTAGDGLLFPTIVLASGNYFWATLVDSSGNNEIVKITEHQSGTDVFQTFARAQDDTTARAFSIGDKVQLRVPKVILETYRDDIATNVTDIAANTALIASEDAVLLARIVVNETDLAGTTNAGSIPAPSGTKMYFYQDTAPSQWTIDTGPADSLLSIKGGSNAYNTSGGATAGTWTPTTHTHTGPSHTHTGPSHTHTGPNHTHTGPNHTHVGSSHVHIWSYNGLYTYNASGGSVAMVTTGLAAGQGLIRAVTSGDGWIRSSETLYTNLGNQGTTGAAGTGNTGSSGTGATGSDGTGATGSDGTGATSSGSAPSTDRPKAAVGLIATKD